MVNWDILSHKRLQHDWNLALTKLASSTWRVWETMTVVSLSIMQSLLSCMASVFVDSSVCILFLPWLGYFAFCFVFACSTTGWQWLINSKIKSNEQHMHTYMPERSHIVWCEQEIIVFFFFRFLLKPAQLCRVRWFSALPYITFPEAHKLSNT